MPSLARYRGLRPTLPIKAKRGEGFLLGGDGGTGRCVVIIYVMYMLIISLSLYIYIKMD